MKVKVSIQKTTQFIVTGFQFIGVLASYVWHIYLPDLFANKAKDVITESSN